jgi:signal peptidase I
VPQRAGIRLFLEWGVVFLVAVLVAVGIRTYCFATYFIPSASMEPTLMVNDRILVDKLSYHLHPVHRGDIVVFAKPANFSDGPGVNDLVKRVIGLPGDRISSENNEVYINGKPLSEPWLPPGPEYWTSGIQTQTVPAGQFFVMGDNRTESADSRVFGTIPQSLIVGEAVVRIWPITRFHSFTNVVPFSLIVLAVFVAIILVGFLGFREKKPTKSAPVV